ncbi:TIGR01777 family oxidoreductase [Marinobacter sp. chi1]|uniref:TIGR01777 family oxidoreductase n=1 Tax=Marinobacter suaedae TaxID=3057675 RepID=A0ABT8W184_9GAMM|nr:TIGR01777 family oxidoreductase [Marinobacter sp. chi1]MDO3722015.1 TIGR01777 family oxidoreductase [Marinobacter sp. chi1]
MSQRILLTGGTGFIGQQLCPTLLEQGYELTVLSRQPAKSVMSLCGPVETTRDLNQLRNHRGFNAIINLAGEGIADKRWSDARKKALRDSRIGLTETLVDVARSWETPPAVMVSGSAVGFYGNQDDQAVTEDTPPRDEFTHQLCRDWENAALQLSEQGVRVCLSRTGIVAGPGGGFLQRMVLPFKLGLGGKLGHGQQYMPWIHRADVVAALVWMLDNPDASGPYNVVSPNPVTNEEFTRTLGDALNRPTVIPAPAVALKLGLGEMSRLLLTGQKALPERLLKEGFSFQFPELGAALADCLRKES